MTTRIPTRSRRQAMDWSLVLVSQGIENIIDHSDEVGWGLIISDTEHERAVQTVEQYRLENRHWRWRQPIGTEVLFDWGSLAWVLVLFVFFQLQNTPRFEASGIMDSAAVSNGEWWRLFTAVLLHGDLGHLAANATLGLMLLGLAMGRFGTGLALFAAFLAGAGGNVATWLAYDQHRSLGASGMVMGCVGLLTAQAFSGPWKARWKYALSGLGGGAMLFALLGLNPGTDVLAHFGGFVSGVVLGLPILAMHNSAQNHRLNTIAGLTFTALVILSWCFALAQ